MWNNYTVAVKNLYLACDLMVITNEEVIIIIVMVQNFGNIGQI